MLITPINSFTPQFQGNKRAVIDSNGKLLYKTTTYFFRDDFDWSSFIDLLTRKYRNVDKVNFIVHACSNGPEAYSTIMKLLATLGERAQKFFPLIAKDIDPNNIENAKNGNKMGITDYDYRRLNYHTGNKVYQYMDFAIPSGREYTMALKPKPFLRNYVQFSQGDIIDDLDNIPKDNTVLMCRNFWLYIDEDKRKIIADKLAKLAPSSLVAIGYYDTDVNVHKLLAERGFVETGVERVFTKLSHPNYRQF